MDRSSTARFRYTWTPLSHVYADAAVELQGRNDHADRGGREWDLAIETARPLSGSPCSSASTAAPTSSSDTVTSTSMSAQACLTAWNEPNGRPNCPRTPTWETVASERGPAHAEGVAGQGQRRPVEQAGGRVAAPKRWTAADGTSRPSATTEPSDLVSSSSGSGSTERPGRSAWPEPRRGGPRHRARAAGAAPRRVRRARDGPGPTPSSPTGALDAERGRTADLVDRAVDQGHRQVEVTGRDRPSQLVDVGVGVEQGQRLGAEDRCAEAGAAGGGPSELLQDERQLREGRTGAPEGLGDLEPEPSGPGQQCPVRRSRAPPPPGSGRSPPAVAGHGPHLVVDRGNPVRQPTVGSRGRPRPRSPMIVRWISLVPPGMVHSHDPMKSSTQAPDSQPLESGLRSTVCPGTPATSAPKSVRRCSSSE